jgi:hypothetical protein
LKTGSPGYFSAQAHRHFRPGLFAWNHEFFPGKSISSGVPFRHLCRSDFAAIRLPASDSRGSNGGFSMISAIGSHRISRTSNGIVTMAGVLEGTDFQRERLES